MFGNAGTGNEDAKTKMKERMQTEKVDTSRRSIHLGRKATLCAWSYKMRELPDSDSVREGVEIAVNAT